MKKIKETVKQWIPLAVAITTVCGLMYVSNQQNIRSAANDPQTQLSQDYAEMSKIGDEQADLSQYSKVDMAKTVSPFVIIVDEDGIVVQANGILGEKTPVPDKKVLETAKKNGRSLVTWEPEKGIRLATVITHFEGANKGYAIAARSLVEIDKRIQQQLYLTIGGYAVAMGLSFISILLLNQFKEKEVEKKSKSKKEK
jgi:hypothetical protein